MNLNVVICGVGGQGVLFIGHILAKALMKDNPDKNITLAKIFDEGQRNGSVSNHIRLTEKNNCVPVISEESANFLCSLDKEEAEVNKSLIKSNEDLILTENKKNCFLLGKIYQRIKNETDVNIKKETILELIKEKNATFAENNIKEFECGAENRKESRIKLVVWDLDNTLWNGTVFYKDKDTITIKPGTKKALKELNKRGIKNTICSKNYYDDAITKLKEFELLDYFEKNVEISFGKKSDAIKKLSSVFNVAFEEILFVDDDPFQRAEVLSQIPNINIIELADPIDILGLEGVLPENATEIDKNRVFILKQQRNRDTAEKVHRGDYTDFLRGCNIEMTVRDVSEKDLPRVTQLLNRTNELNATNNRYSVEEIKNNKEEKGDLIFVVELKDKFGEYGIIAEAIIDITSGDWLIKDLTVSCRTMGRSIGTSLLITILNEAKNRNISKVRGYINETESNWRMKPLFEKRGFSLVSTVGNITNYEIELKDKKLLTFPDWIAVVNNIK